VSNTIGFTRNWLNIMNDGRSLIELIGDARKLVAVREAAANLIAQLSELDELRERVRKAEQSAHTSQRTSRRKGHAFRKKRSEKGPPA
jgi:glycerol-3-phosphate O-acyltransferase